MDDQTIPETETTEPVAEPAEPTPEVTFETEEALYLLLNQDHSPEMHLRRLKTGGYVAGIELSKEKYRSATGETVAEALENLRKRLQDSY